MSKEEAIHVSAQLLRRMFDNNDESSIPAIASVCSAEADGDIDKLCSALDSFIAFCEKLKRNLYGQQ